MVLPSESSIIEGRTKSVVDDLCGNMQVIGRLGKAYQFDTLFALQPTLFTKKVVSSEETALLGLLAQIAPSFKPVFEYSYGEIRGRFGQPDHCGVNFVGLSDAVDTDHSIYVDSVHVSPLGNNFAARAMFNALAANLPDRIKPLESN